MARYIRSVAGYNEAIATPSWRVAASTTINAGDLVQVDAATRYLKPAVASSTTIAGIAQGAITTGATVTTSDKITVNPATNIVIRVGYVGSTKTSLTDADLATTKFNLKDANNIDLDNTTSGMCTVVAYDNVKKTADIIIADANITKIG